MKLTDLIAKESQRTKQEIKPPEPIPARTFKKERAWLDASEQIKPKDQNRPKVDFSSKEYFAEISTLETKGLEVQHEDLIEQLKPEAINEPKVQNIPKVSSGQVPRQRAAQELISKYGENFHTGFTRVPNEIFLRLISGELSKVETQVLLTIVRLTIGFNKKSAPISIGIISKLTKLPSSKISHSLNTLQELNLVSRQSGNASAPNTLTMIFSEASKIEETKITNEPQVQNIPGALNEPGSLGTNSALDLRHKKYLHNIQETNKHSLAETSVVFDEYFSKLASAKAKKERDALKLLQNQFSGDDIQRAFDYVQKFGDLAKGQSCHSPFSYLSHAMPEVLKKARPKAAQGTQEILATTSVQADELDAEIDERFKSLSDFQDRLARFDGDHQKAKAMWSIEEFKKLQGC